MKVSDFSFDLPDNLIARYPQPERSASRLLQLQGDSGKCTDRKFTDIVDLVEAGDLLVFNNTRVIPARLYGRKASGGKLEVLVERIIDEHSILAHVRCSKSPKPGAILFLGGDVVGEEVLGEDDSSGDNTNQDKNKEYQATMVARHDALFEIRFSNEKGDEQKSVLEILEHIGHMPLPPYIDRPDEDSDKERYQTVYNEKPGAVAAPTAGLHFDHDVLKALSDKGVEFAYVTLHVGAGTFQPVRVDNILEHHMHAEYVEVPKEVVEAIAKTKQKGGRIVAVGTTSVRSLESAAQDAKQKGTELAPFFGDTEIFIYPGYEYQVVDALVTNFHLPESTLIMLVSAFAGYENTMQAYQHAVKQEYRFFSYGDAMFITPQSTS